MVANLFGDFCKGNAYLKYPKKIQEGVTLHRSIDFFIDTHPEVLKVKKKLYVVLPKVSGIAIDLYFDHLLAKNWDYFHSKSLLEFLELFYQHTFSINEAYPKEFVSFIKKLRESKWINHYPSAFGFQKSCEGVSRRLSFENKLGDSPKLILPFKEHLTKAFDSYMIDAREKFNASFKT